MLAVLSQKVVWLPILRNVLVHPIQKLPQRHIPLEFLARLRLALKNIAWPAVRVKLPYEQVHLGATAVQDLQGVATPLQEDEERLAEPTGIFDLEDRERVISDQGTGLPSKPLLVDLSEGHNGLVQVAPKQIMRTLVQLDPLQTDVPLVAIALRPPSEVRDTGAIHPSPHHLVQFRAHDDIPPPPIGAIALRR
eukprot:CAMPEP_0198545130 /NCGR_PEP_ID=MMETSP1462-20131121/63115_1 /TAXON_ID=1333877 /ORGANISM="Brandtodinium nutriculum, Strain RCC3387" /LENGTH=192 /DNA_ID=CAMNT_0044275501 /DNA_START=135 /DNA_END=713 /DNA_ORIENTATION=-